MSRKVVFLDRDGTINVDHGYVHRIEDWQFIDGAIEAIRLLRSSGYAVAVVTNQSGVAAGYHTEHDVEVLHGYLQEQLRQKQTVLDAIVYCPHGSEEGCSCRKPRTGMADQVAKQLGEPIDYASSWMVGDKPSDIQFGAALGTSTVLLPSRYWSDDNMDCRPTMLAPSLFQAAEQIIARYRF